MGNMKVLNLIQGSDEWLAERMLNRTASEAPAMMGDSKYQTRDQLLKLKKTGVAPEVSPELQRRFDAGHATEAKARPIAEEIIGDILFPVTAKNVINGINMLASMDGLTEMYDIGFEHKLWNGEVAENIRNKIIEPTYYWQMEQHMLVTPAKKILFMVSYGTREKMVWMWYESVPERREQLIAGWKQFDKDLEAYEVKAVAEKTVAQSIETLPALSISISGEVSASNLQAYEDAAMNFISTINTDLQSDQDFTDAKAMVKFCDDAEKELKAAKERALSQTEDIAALFTTLDKLGASIREKRLNLNRQVTDQTASKKKALIDAATSEVLVHFNNASDSVGISLPAICPDYEGAIKRKSNFELMEGSLNDLVASTKIQINETADNFRANLKVMNDAEASFLFPDIRQVISNPLDHFTLMVESRVNAEKQRLEAERERIRKEEQDKAEKAAEKKRLDDLREEEQQRLKDEQAKRDEEAARLLEIAKEQREKKADDDRAKLQEVVPGKRESAPAEVITENPLFVKSEHEHEYAVEHKEIQFKVVDLNGLPDRFVNIDIIGIRAELEVGNSVTGVEVIG